MAAGVHRSYLSPFHTTLTLLHISLLALVTLTIGTSMLMVFPEVLDAALERFAWLSGATYVIWGLGLFAFLRVRPRLLADLGKAHQPVDGGIDRFLRRHARVFWIHVVTLLASVAVSWMCGRSYSWSVLLGQGIVSLVIAGGATLWLVAGLRTLLVERRPVFAHRGSAQTTSVVGF
jgi:hypothetical protein